MEWCHLNIQLFTCPHPHSPFAVCRGAERSDDVITSLECGNTTFIDGFGSSGGSSCQLVSVYQTCLENSEVGASISAADVVSM